MDVSKSQFAYGQLIADLWAKKRRFLLVEHDIELTEKALRQAMYCPCQWGISPYSGPLPIGDSAGADPLLYRSLGCTRFGARLMRAFPQVMAVANSMNDAGPTVPPGHWQRLDCRILGALSQEGLKPHHHSVVPHHHRYDTGCACGADHA